MPEQPRAGRLEPELLAAYIDGLLPPEERARVEAEIAADPEHYEWVVNSINAVDDVDGVLPSRDAASTTTPAPMAVQAPVSERGSESGGRELPYYRRRAVLGGISALLATAATLAVAIRWDSAPMRRRVVSWAPSIVTSSANLNGGGIDKLVYAVGEERYIEARISGGFKYGPLRQVMRGPAGKSEPDSQLLAVALELQAAAKASSSAENLHAWGVAQLFLGQYAESLVTLRAALATADEPAIRSDLAAALVANGRFRDDSRDFEEAIVLLSDLGTPEALYNRALALSALGRTDEADRVWQAAARAEQGGGWAADAAARVGRR